MMSIDAGLEYRGIAIEANHAIGLVKDRVRHGYTARVGGVPHQQTGFGPGNKTEIM
jgi:hypothetical protein